MSRILAMAVLLAVSTSSLAASNVIQDRWRSPFTPAPAGTSLSPLDTEKQIPIEQREMAAWRQSHPGSWLARHSK